MLVLSALAISLAAQQPKIKVPTGLVLLDPATYQSIPLASTPLMGQLPAAVDLSDHFPRPGDQGSQNSCVGWAVAYGLKSYQEAVKRKWYPTTADRVFSPAYVYNQIKSGSDCQAGTSYADALNLMRREGVAPLSDFPYNEAQCSSLPSLIVKSKARLFAIADWRRVNVQDETEIKNHIASGFPVLVGMIVDEPFFHLRGETLYSQPSGQKLGAHAVVVVAYDDAKQAFKILNSWGTNWGQGGYGWISYVAFRRIVREAYVVQDIIAIPPPSPPEPPRRVEPPAPPPAPVASLGLPEIQHNIMVAHPAGLPSGLGMLIRLPGSLRNATGRRLQIVVRFAFQNGPGLYAHPQEYAFRDVQGFVATGTPAIQVTSPQVNLADFTMSIPYYALNLQPTNGQFTYRLRLRAFVYLDNFVIAESADAPFNLAW